MKRSYEILKCLSAFFCTVGTLMVGVGVGIAICGSYTHHYQPITTTPPEPKSEYVYVEQEPEVVVEYVYIPFEEVFFRNHTEREEWCLKDLAMREGEGEGVIGMLWIMYTVECRCEAFGHSIEEEWAGSAFQTSMNRSGLEPNEDCLKAYELFREGWEPKPLYFGAGYYHDFATDLCQVGNHCFSSK